MSDWSQSRRHRSARPAQGEGAAMLREHVAQLESKLKTLTESFDVADRYIQPWERYMDGGRILFPSGFPTDRKAGRDWPIIATEMDLRQARAFCRLIGQTNPLVIAFLDHVTNFVVKTGFKWHVQIRGAKKSRPGGDIDPDVKACQSVLDEFRQLAGWGDDSGFTIGEFDDDDYSPQVNLEHEGWRRAMRDGEFFLRLFRGGAETNGVPTCRVVEPECVQAPNGDTQDDWSWGIMTADGDIQRRKAFYVLPKDGMTEGEAVPAGRMLQMKFNVDGDIKRGIPDFWPLQDEVQNAQKLWRNTLEVNAILAAIAYIRQHAPGITGTQVNTMLTQRSTDGTSINRAGGYPYYANDRGTDRTNLYTKSEAGQVIDISNQMQYVPGPSATGTPGQISALQAIFRIVGIRWGCPEYFSGDSSNANFASTLVSGGPFEVACVMRQGHYKRFQGELAKRVLILACESGRLRRDQVVKMEVTVTPPAVAIANKAEDTQRRNTLAQSAGLSKTTWLMEEGYDAETEAANRDAEAKADAAQQQPPGAGGAPVPAGPDGGPTPSPLTNGPDAGGGDVDLSTLLGESKRVSEARLRLLHEIDPPDGFMPDGTAFYLEDRSGLVKKVITNKLGKSQTIYVRPNTDAAADADKTVQAQADSRTAVATAVGQLDRLTMSQFHRLDSHIAALSRDEIRGHLKALGEKIGGAKVALAERLLAKVRAEHGKVEPATRPRPEPDSEQLPLAITADGGNITGVGSQPAAPEPETPKMDAATASTTASKKKTTKPQPMSQSEAVGVLKGMAPADIDIDEAVGPTPPGQAVNFARIGLVNWFNGPLHADMYPGKVLPLEQKQSARAALIAAGVSPDHLNHLHPEEVAEVQRIIKGMGDIGRGFSTQGTTVRYKIVDPRTGNVTSSPVLDATPEGVVAAMKLAKKKDSAAALETARRIAGERSANNS